MWSMSRPWRRLAVARRVRRPRRRRVRRVLGDADALFADQGRLEYPHLWTRAGCLGLDVEGFEADRRSDGVCDRVRDDFRGGVKA